MRMTEEQNANTLTSNSGLDPNLRNKVTEYNKHYSMGAIEDPDIFQVLKNSEAEDQLRKYFKKSLKKGQLTELKTKLRNSLQMEGPLVLEAVTGTVLKCLTQATETDEILRVLGMIKWLVGLRVQSVRQFWAANLESIKSVQRHAVVARTGHTLWPWSWWPFGRNEKIKKLDIIQQIGIIESELKGSPLVPSSKSKGPSALGQVNYESEPAPGSGFHPAQAPEQSPENPLPVQSNSRLSLDSSVPEVRFESVYVDLVTAQSALDENRPVYGGAEGWAQRWKARYPRSNQVLCPRCERRVYLEQVGLLAECRACDFSFCTNCGQSYHGGLDCVTGDSSKSISGIKVGNGADIGSHEGTESEFGPIAMPHELGFYGTRWEEPRSEIQSFGPDDISNAFRIRPGPDEDWKELPVSWPWEDRDRYPDHSYYRRFPYKYRSLNPGEWVEDEVIEEALSCIVSLRRARERVAILESYMQRWGMQKSYEDGTFRRMVLEKGVLSKSLVVALINSDQNGSGGHWILGIIVQPQKRIILMDSSIVPSTSFYQKHFFYLLHVLHVAQELDGAESGNWAEWELIVSLNGVQQNNSSDCGPIVVANFYALLQRQMLSQAPASHRLRYWIHDILSRAPETESTNMEYSSNPGDPDILIRPFSPVGLQFSYRDTQNQISDIFL